MAREKRASDELYNQRRRLKRAAERAEKAGRNREAAELMETARSLYVKNISSDKAGTQAYNEKIQAAIDRTAYASAQTLQTTASRNAAGNRLLQGTTLGSRFYSATKNFWLGKDAGQRNQAILEGLSKTVGEEITDLISALEWMAEITGQSWGVTEADALGGAAEQYTMGNTLLAMAAITRYSA